MIYKRIKDVAVLLNGYAFKSKEYVESGIRVIRIANVQDGYISDEKPCFYPHSAVDEIDKYMLQEGDLLISLTGNVGRVGILTPEFIPAALNQRVSCIRIKPDSELDLSFLYYYLLRKQFVRDCIKASKGVAQLNLSTKWLENYLIPVPDLELQKRIVSHIEESLSQLDSAVETLKKTKQQLDVYRQAVLREVFSQCEQSVEIKTVCKHVTDGDHMPPPKAETGIPFIMISNINGNTIDWSDTSFVGKEYYNTIGDKRTPQKGDVLYTVTGSFGIPVLIDFEKEFCFQRHIALLRPNEKIEQEFLYYALQDNIVYAQASKRATGTAQKTVGLTVLRTIKIPFTTSIEKQSMMVSIIKNRLSQCDMVEKTVNQSLQQAEALRQSILKQAFEEE